jgi:putative peptide zinc metalloprotease protein
VLAEDDDARARYTARSVGAGRAAYGAVSLLAGLALIAVSVAIQWQVLGGLITALATGSVPDILIGCYLVVPLAIAVLASLAGLIARAVAASSDR